MMFWKRYLRLLRSLRLTVFLIICLASVFLLGVLVPQKDLLGHENYLAWKNAKPLLVSSLEYAGLTDIYTSPVTLLLWTLFFLNLVLVMIHRIPFIWRRCLSVEVPRSKDTLDTGRYSEVFDSCSLSDIDITLRAKGYRFVPERQGFAAVKNRFSPLATILFHVSFILMLIGAVSAFYTKFRAEADVAVGETFRGDYRWARTPRFGDIPQTEFILQEVKPKYYNGNLPVELKITLLTEKGKEYSGINRPYKQGSLSFVVEDIDVAPLFILKDGKGKEIEGAFYKLLVLKGREDSFKMGRYEFRTIFYTNIDDLNRKGHDDLTNVPQVMKQSPVSLRDIQTSEIVNPAFLVSVVKEGKELVRKVIRMGESIYFDGYSLEFRDLEYWVKFYVGKEHGLPLVYAGFCSATVALIIRFLFYRRDIKGIIEGNIVHVTGKAEFYPTLFDDEFRSIVRDIKIKAARNDPE